MFHANLVVVPPTVASASSIDATERVLERMDVGGVEPLPGRVVLVKFVCSVREGSEE